ncbi:MAG: rhodanese-like domain-containing protein [Lachnospiraceae bacterium]|nr:rhodanese-like domain-containing protein [Lachnospiraceae bacterium]
MSRGTKKRAGVRSRLAAVVCMTGLMLWGCGKQEPVSYTILTEYASLPEIAGDTDEKTVLIDLRDNSDYEYMHIDGALNVPYEEDGTWLLKYLEENEMKDKELYLMCGGGKKSADAFNLLVRAGYRKVHYVSFGFEEYIEACGTEAAQGAAICDCYKDEK